MVKSIILNLLILIIAGFCLSPVKLEPMTLSLTISAKWRYLEVSWSNAAFKPGCMVIITNHQPTYSVEYNKLRSVSCFDGNAKTYHNDTNGFHCNIAVESSSAWIRTSIPYDQILSTKVTNDTGCYGYWANFIDDMGNVYESTCLRADALWMNKMRPGIEKVRFRDLLIPGSHDSGSYRPGYKPERFELRKTKYTLTQDEDIRGQLMHGIRYLDIRVGYYPKKDHQFWINHGAFKLIPLIDTIRQVKDFVRETNEIVIFDVQEFPEGFGKTLDVHKKLVEFLKTEFKDVMVNPTEVNWHSSLGEIWKTKRNVIVTYDHYQVYNENHESIFWSVQQRWGDKRKWDDLEKFLITTNQDVALKYSSRPIAAMAELTPDVWAVILDQSGGLRKLADEINSKVSLLYRYELREGANVVAVDFFRGTNIVQTALYENERRIAAAAAAN